MINGRVATIYIDKVCLKSDFLKDGGINNIFEDGLDGRVK
tara:strand:+ start:128 stop:247 length:120 start_codon:yes stop_codon:yes gene_type:complete